MLATVLYCEGCPHYEPTVDLIREVARAFGLATEIREVEVRTPDEAQRLRFLGSPTVQVDGEDIEVSRRGHTEFALSCRMYGSAGVPPRDMVVAAFAERRNA